MGLAFSGIRKTDNETLYFRDMESFDGYVKAHPNENVEFDGLAQTTIMTKVIDMNVDRKLFEGFIDSVGIDKNAVKYEDLFTAKDVDVEQTQKRIEENRMKAKKVVTIDKQGQLQDCDDDPALVSLLHNIVDMKHQLQVALFTAKSFEDDAGYNEVLNKIGLTEESIDGYFEDALNMNLDDVVKLVNSTATDENNKKLEKSEYMKFKNEVEDKTDIVLSYVSKKQEEKEAAESKA